VVMFRGAATGCGLTEKTNQRIQISLISKLYPELIDAGLTSFNSRLKIDPTNGYCDYINLEHVLDQNVFDLYKDLKQDLNGSKQDKGLKQFKIKDLKSNFIEMDQQIRYKYILDIEGHTAAYRLPKLLSMHVVVLKVDSPWYIWIQSDIMPKKLVGLYHNEINTTNVSDVHYVRIRTKDNVISLKDLLSCIDWLKKNDSLAQKIAENGFNYFMSFLRVDGICDYMQKVINQIC
jgi:hypothetical protein